MISLIGVSVKLFLEKGVPAEEPLYELTSPETWESEVVPEIGVISTIVHSSLSRIPSLSSSISQRSVILSPSLSIPLTVISKEHVAVFPAKSVLTQVLVVTPIGNKLPLGRPDVWTVLVEPQLSIAVGVVKV